MTPERAIGIPLIVPFVPVKVSSGFVAIPEVPESGAGILRCSSLGCDWTSTKEIV